MDPWKEYAAWQIGRDVVRDWAAMEDKSLTMSEDLLRDCAPRRRFKPFLAALSVIAHVSASLVELWRMFRSG
jgi:hypothetical protein